MGGIHGLAQIVEREYNERRGIVKNKNDVFSARLYKRVGTIIFVSFAWVFFRAASFKEAIAYIVRMLSSLDITVLFSHKIYELGLNVVEMGILCVSLLIFIVFDYANYKYDKREFELVDIQGTFFKWIVNLFLICFIVIFGIYGTESMDASFIYFQF